MIIITNYIKNKKIETIKLIHHLGYINRKNTLILINKIRYGKLTCGICKKPFGKRTKKTIDHIISKSKGGKTHINNLQLAHKSCNNWKGDKYEKRKKINCFRTR